MKSFTDFKTALGYAEGSGDYKADNKKGFIGKYQFGKLRLKDLGYTGSSEYLKSNPQLQENLFLAHVQDHGKYLLKYLLIAKSKFGKNVTLSGLIAGAHLKGRGSEKYQSNCKLSGVIQFVLYGVDCADGNGTKISTYVNKFSGYEIPGFNEMINQETENHFPDQKGNVKNDFLPFILIGIAIFVTVVIMKNHK